MMRAALLLAAAVQAAPALESPLPVDPAVRIGRLPNGLTYYVRPNPRPAKRVALRLAVKAGSILEQEDERGLAHFLEHMAFNGSKHFRPGELVAFFESIGARFGADANAWTSFDETVYTLDVPTDEPGLVQKGLLALSDFVARADLAPAEVEKERGVVLEEWRLGQGAGSRVQRKQLPVLLHGSRYAERLPIGDPEVLRSFPPESLRAFARRWYRPDRMALVVVGDLDPAQAEAWIREAFADVPAAGPGPTPPVHPIPTHPETLVSVASDPEVRSSSVAVVFKHARLPEKTVADYRRWLVDRLVHQMINERLDGIARRADAPFLAATASSDTWGRTVDALSVGATVAEGGIEAGLRAILEETERVRRHGFRKEELDRARRWQLALYERGLNEKDKSESGSFAREYVGHFLDEEPIPGIVEEHRIAQAYLPTVTLDEVQSAARRLIHEDSRVVLAVAPEKEGLATPSEAALRGVVATVMRAEIGPWTEAALRERLVETPPAPGKATARRTVAGLGATVLTLSNGVTVWLKPTDFKNDQVLFTATARGGSSLAEPAGFRAASFAASAVAEAGFGGLGPTEIEKVLAGRLVSSTPTIGHYTHGLGGSSTPRDLESMLQLVHLQLTAPDDRPASFEVVRRRLESVVLNRAKEPTVAYLDKLQELNTDGHYMHRPLTLEEVRALRFADALAFYRRAYRNAADLTFFLVGAFEVEAMVPLLERWIASLPSEGRATSDLVDRGLRFPAASRSAEVRRGLEPKAAATLTFFADTTGDPLAAHRADAAASVLRSRLREILREEMSGTYGVSVRHANSEPLPGYGTVSVSFGSAPANVDTLVQAVLTEIRRLQAEGPSAENVDHERAMQTRELEVAERQNGFWLSMMVAAHQRRREPVLPATRREWIEGLTPAVLQEAFRRAFPMDRYTTVILRPER